MKGQVTFINLIILLVTLFVYMMMLPILNDFINTTAAGLLANPNVMTQAVVVMLYLLPFLLTLMIVMTGFNYAIPHREGQ